MDIHTTIIFKAPILNGINYHKPCKQVKTSHNGIISPNSIKLPGKIMEPNPMWSRHINDTSQWHMAHISWQSDHLRSSHPIMTIITSQAESPLDKQIKSSLLADAFNLLGVRRLDAQTLTSARLRARFLCLGGVNLLGNDKVMMSGFWSDFIGIF